VAVTATVQRAENDYVILSFAEPLSYSLIMAEQRRLLRLFPRGALVGSAERAEKTIGQSATAVP